jgi:hypothetical protein
LFHNAAGLRFHFNLGDGLDLARRYYALSQVSLFNFRQLRGIDFRTAVREGDRHTYDEDYYHYHCRNNDDSSAPFLLYVSVTVHNSSFKIRYLAALGQWYEPPANFVPSTVEPGRNQSRRFQLDRRTEKMKAGSQLLLPSGFQQLRKMPV